ncbi:MAG: diguanylate cyclase [Spirochaetes bacterium]|nr:diguanylate cyclase [Spirochaetota bacterium]
MRGDMELSVEFLKTVEIFSLLEPDEINRIVKLFEPLEIDEGNVLFREGDPGNQLFIVMGGSVASSIRLPDGGDREIALFRPGNFFGEMSIFENAPRSATCFCREKSALLGLHEKDFYRMIKREPGIATKIMYRMLNITTQRLRDTGEFLSDMVHWGDAASRRAITDELTGAYNRRYLDDALASQFERAKNGGMPLTLIMVDLDYFRAINESYGHEAGDRCIVEVVRVFGRAMREGDILARFGGDEFTVLLPDTPAETGRGIAESVRKDVEAMDFLEQYRGPVKKLTLSMGIASYPEHADNLKTLRERADQALYAAKEGGRNRAVVAAGGLVKKMIETIHEKNRVIDNIIGAMQEKNHFLVLGHKNPDEDCIGSMVAIALIAGKFFKKAQVYISESMHEHFQYLLDICRHNAIGCSGLDESAATPVDAIIICDTPKPAMIDASERISSMLEDGRILKIEIDHHLGADSRYIGDEGYRLVTEATSSSELVGLIALKLAKREDLLKRYNILNPVSRNVILSVLTGIVGDTNMGQFIQSKRQRRYYDIFSNLYNSMLATETVKETNFMNKDEVFHEIQRLSSHEARCFQYISGKKKFSKYIGYVVLDAKDMTYLAGEFDHDTIVSVTRSVADSLAEESGRLGLVAYDDSRMSGLVQFRLRRGHDFKTFDLRRVLDIFNFNEGGGHEGAIGFRISHDRIGDMEGFVEELVAGIEKTVAGLA